MNQIKIDKRYIFKRSPNHNIVIKSIYKHKILSKNPQVSIARSIQKFLVRNYKNTQFKISVTKIKK